MNQCNGTNSLKYIKSRNVVNSAYHLLKVLHEDGDEGTIPPGVCM